MGGWLPLMDFSGLSALLWTRAGELTNHSINLIDEIWVDRPTLGLATPWPITNDVAGKSMGEKLADLDGVLIANSCDAVLLTRADALIG